MGLSGPLIKEMNEGKEERGERSRLKAPRRWPEAGRRDVARGAEIGEEGPRSNGRGAQESAAASGFPRETAGGSAAGASGRRHAMPLVSR